MNTKSKTLNDHPSWGASRTIALAVGQRARQRAARLSSRWLQFLLLKLSLPMSLKFAPVQILVCDSPDVRCASPRITDFFS